MNLACSLRRALCGVAWLLGLLPAGPATALETDRDQPFSVKARQVELDQKTGHISYRGNVTLTQGSLRIQADSLEAHTRRGQPESLLARGNPIRVSARPEGKEADVELRAQRLEFHRPTQRLRLEGGVELVHDEFRVEAGQLDYRRPEEQIDMSGHVTLRRGKDVFSAPWLHIDLAENRLVAGSPPGSATRERVTAVLYSRKNRL